MSKAVLVTTLGVMAAVIICTGCATAPVGPNQVAPGFWEGSQPKTRADFQELREHGIKTIVSLRTSPWTVSWERKRAWENGMDYIHIPLPAWPLPPSERTVRRVLLTLRDQSRQPIFMHCYLGRDRGAMIIALYRLYYENVPPEAAWEEALGRGLKQRWALQGLRIYFWEHAKTPAWAKESRSPPPGSAAFMPPRRPDDCSP